MVVVVVVVVEAVVVCVGESNREHGRVKAMWSEAYLP